MISDFPNIASPNPVNQLTCGDWIDEEAAKADLDARLAQMANLFSVYKEVPGYYVQPRYLTETKSPRIDRLLVPKNDLNAKGWRYGCIGIECKVSGTKLGPVVAQSQDYARAVYKLKTSGIDVMCPWIFIWPLRDAYGDIASQMTQNRIGAAYGDSRCLLGLKCGPIHMLRVTGAHEFVVGNVVCGNKVGSR